MDVVTMRASQDAVAQLTLTGAVAETASFSLGFAVAQPVAPPQPEPAGAMTLAVDLLDDKGETLLSTLVLGAPLCMLPSSPDFKAPLAGEAYLVQSLIPLVHGAQTLVVREPGRELLRRAFPQNSPQVSALEVKRGDTSLEVSWQAEHPDGSPLEHVVVARDPDAVPSDWILASLPSDATHVQVMPSLRAKRLELAVMTTDGLHTVLSDPVPAEPLARVPAVAILSPAGGEFSSPLALAAYSSEDGAADGQWGLTRVEWRSADAGLIAIGTSQLARLSAGKHVISATLLAQDGSTLAQDSVEIIVTDPGQPGPQ